MLDARGAVDLMKGDGAGSSVRGMVGLSWRKRKRSEFKETAPRGTRLQPPRPGSYTGRSYMYITITCTRLLYSGMSGAAAHGSPPDRLIIFTSTNEHLMSDFLCLAK
jgi:hypothetical protein